MTPPSHGGGHAVEHADKAGGCAHDDGNPAADGSYGKKLNQSHQSRHQHGVLQEAQLQGGEFAACNPAGPGDNQQGRQVAHEHGEHMLQSQGNGLAQGHFAVQLEGGV